MEEEDAHGWGPKTWMEWVKKDHPFSRHAEVSPAHAAAGVTFDYSDFLIRFHWGVFELTETLSGGYAHSRLGTSQLRGRRVVADRTCLGLGRTRSRG